MKTGHALTEMVRERVLVFVSNKFCKSKRKEKSSMSQGCRHQGQIAAAESTAGGSRHQSTGRLPLRIRKLPGQPAKKGFFQPLKRKGIRIVLRGGHPAVIAFQTALLI